MLFDVVSIVYNMLRLDTPVCLTADIHGSQRELCGGRSVGHPNEQIPAGGFRRDPMPPALLHTT